ncbi:Rieske 2Fe-2S domain-containing protein [Bacillus sp. 7884-1]|uniref:Rieske 2Fe-2S domain-containing protein n=1 Tax=Bacillus sp. 7884-1 TaxID=2021693 RepID=UPI0027BAC2F2|nr:Rieske 2Fe-2S domain-containing protein [Bacillus sp. 7884-1]
MIFQLNKKTLINIVYQGSVYSGAPTCTHRGTLLCTSDSGKQKSFTCPFHGWTYNNEGDLVGIAVGNKVYGKR